MYKTKTLKDFAIGLSILGVLGTGAYIWQGCNQRAREDRIYKASPYYKQVEEFRQGAIRDGSYDNPEVKEAVEDMEVEARKTAVLEAESKEAKKIYDSIDTKVR